MPTGILPVNPTRTGKPPKNAEEFNTVLWHWLRNEPDLQDATVRRPYEDYVTTTVLLAKDYGMPVALAYHAEVVKALLREPCPLYDPYKHGDVYQPAYQALVHGKPKVGATTTRSASKRGQSWVTPAQTGVGAKRKRNASASPQDDCDIPGHIGHTNADCRYQLLKKRPKKKKAKGSDPAPASEDD